MTDTGNSEAKRSFVRDVSSVFGSKVFVLGITFFSGIILARQLGPDGLGIFAALLVYPTLVHGIAELGVRQSTLVHIGRRTFPEEDILSAVVTLLCITSLVGVLLVGGVYWWLDNPNFTLPLIVLALSLVPIKLTISYAAGVFLGKEKIGRFNRLNWVPTLLKFFLIVFLVWLVGMYVMGALLALILSSMVTAVYAWWTLSHMIPIRIRWHPEIAKQLVSLGAVFAAALFTIRLNYRVDLVLLERLASASDLGHYTLGVSLAEQLWKLPAALGVVVFSRSANAADAQAFSLKVGKLLRVTLIVATVGAIALYAVAGVIVPLIYGEAFLPSVGVINYILPGIVAFTVYKILLMDLAGKGRPSLSLLVMVPTVGLNVVLNLLWIPRFGIQGAALASTVSYTVAAVVFVIVYARSVSIPISALVRYRRGDFDVFTGLIGKIRKAFA